MSKRKKKEGRICRNIKKKLDRELTIPRILAMIVCGAVLIVEFI